MGRFYEKLNDSEEIIFRTHTHLYKIISSLPILFFGWFSIFFLYVGLAYLTYATIRHFYYEYVITNQRLIIKKGFYYLRLESIPHYKIEEVLIRQSFFDKIIGGGTIFIFGSSIKTRKLNKIGKPKTFRSALYSQLPASNLGYFEHA